MTIIGCAWRFGHWGMVCAGDFMRITSPVNNPWCATPEDDVMECGRYDIKSGQIIKLIIILQFVGMGISCLLICIACISIPIMLGKAAGSAMTNN